MTKRFPVPASGTEASSTSDVAAVLDEDRGRVGARPALAASDDVRMHAGMPSLRLPFPLLGVQIEKTRHGDLRKQLGRRELLRRQIQLHPGLALGDAHRIVDDGGRVDLYGHRVGVGRLQ